MLDSRLTSWGIVMSEKLKFKTALEQLSSTITDVMVTFDGIPSTDLPTLLKAFAELRDNKKRLEELLKSITLLYTTLDNKVIPDAFEALGFDSVKSSGRNFILSTRINANITEDKRPAAHKWIEEEAKVPELIQSRINPKQLSSFVAEYFETNGKWPPEDLISVHKQNYIQVRKAT